MKKNTLLILFFSVISVIAFADIPVMNWNKRNDWVDITTDVTPAAIPNDGLDDTAAIQAALDMLHSTSGITKTVYFPAGTYQISQTLTLGPKYGTALIGHGADTVLEWHGATGGIMFLSDGVTRARYIGLTWDGRNVAAMGIDHDSSSLYESRTRHENEEFRNFTTAGIMSGYNDTSTPTAETMVYNCKFENNGMGICIGYTIYNYYNWYINACDFIDNDIAIYSKKGKYYATECHFENSTTCDMLVHNGQKVRRCTSKGSKIFYETGKSSSNNITVIENCVIEDWTGTEGIIRPGSQGPIMVYDCKFLNPRNSTAPPINLINVSVVPQSLLVSNNESNQTTAIVTPGQNSSITEIPQGKIGASLYSSSQSFMNSTTVNDSNIILDVTQSPYNAVADNSTDATAAIQAAIDDAISNNNGTIVYIPAGNYLINGTLDVSGSNYTIQGTGFFTRLMYGGTTGPLMEITSPDNIKLEQFFTRGDYTIVKIRQTGSGDGSIVYDGVYCDSIDNFAHNYAKGFEFDGLGSGMFVDLKHSDGPMEFYNCASAEILGSFSLSHRVLVEGASAPKTGFSGLDFGSALEAMDLHVKDNLDFIIGYFYVEQSGQHLLVEGSTGSDEGRVSIQGVKQQSYTSADIITVNNYKGRVAYFNQNFQSSLPHQINQTGTNPVDIIVAGSCFWETFPVLSLDTGANMIMSENLISHDNTFPIVQDIMPSDALESMALALDHFRELGARLMKKRYGYEEGVTNGLFEFDTVNQNPGIVLGDNPVDWLSGGESDTGGVRDVCVVADPSTFGDSDNSLLFYDDITSGGSRLDARNYYDLDASADDPGRLTFDIKVNTVSQPSGTMYFRTFTGDNKTMSSLGFVASSGAIRATVNGSTTTIQTLNLDTWYRISIDIPAPSSTSNECTITITDTSGNSNTYQIHTKTPAATQAFSRSYLNFDSVSAVGSYNLDNVSFITYK